MQNAQICSKKNMFILTRIKEKVRVDPNNFDKSDQFQVAIEDVLNEKYCDKVLPNVGLCITVYDVLEIGAPYIYPGDGGVHCEVVFRVVVFKPMIDEVICGKLIRADKEKGLILSLGFFEQVVIPPHLLQANSGLYVY